MWFVVGVLLAAVPMLASAQWYEVTQVAGDPNTIAECRIEAASVHQHLVGAGASTTNGLVALLETNAAPSFTCVRASDGTTYTGVHTPGGASLTTLSRVRVGFSVSGSSRYVYFTYQQTDVPQCVTGQIDALGKCFECPEGRIWNGTTCESPCQAKAGNSVGTASSFAEVEATGAGTGATTFCAGECIAKGQKIECQASGATATGDYVSLGELCLVQGPFTYTGASCVDGPNNPGLVDAFTEDRPWWDTGKDEKDCIASGGQPGQVGGVDVCLRRQDGETWDTSTETVSEPSKETTTNADGTTTEKTTTTTTSTDGGKTTTTTTTTTVIKDAAGNTLDTSSETKVEDKPLNDFCKEKPTAAACVNQTTDGAFGGGCETGFTCTGDAVQCAIARAQHQQNCQELAARQEGQGFMDSLGATDPTQASVAEALNRQGEFDFDIAEAFQDAQQNYVSFTASCLPAMGFTLKGQYYEFKTAFICEIGDFVRLMLHLVAYMSVLRVISRAFG